MKGYENLGIVSQFLDEYHKLKNVMRKHLPSHQKLVTVRGQQRRTLTWELRRNYLMKITRLKSIMREHLPSQWKLVIEKQKRYCTGTVTSQSLSYYSISNSISKRLVELVDARV